MVDGKKKLVEVIKADHMSKPDQTKKICERMVLQEKVHVLWGTDGSNLMKIINETATKYKVIAQNTAALSDELQDATNFSRYSFMTSISTDQIGRGIAYYYGQIRKKEKKFYILCQDYMFGHSMAAGFKKRAEGVLSCRPDRRRGLPQAVSDRLCPLPDQDQGFRRRGRLHRRLDSRCRQPAQAGAANGDHASLCQYFPG